MVLLDAPAGDVIRGEGEGTVLYVHDTYDCRAYQNELQYCSGELYIIDLKRKVLAAYLLVCKEF